MNNDLEEKLNTITQQIEEIEFALKICDKHVEYINEKKKAETDKFMTKSYDSQIGKDAYRRMEMQDKLRKLMRDCMEVQDKLCTEND